MSGTPEQVERERDFLLHEYNNLLGIFTKWRPLDLKGLRWRMWWHDVKWRSCAILGDAEDAHGPVPKVRNRNLRGYMLGHLDDWLIEHVRYDDRAALGTAQPDDLAQLIPDTAKQSRAAIEAWLKTP